MTKRDKITVDEVIGLIHTDEPTNSVEEVRKLRGRDGMTENKRFELTYERGKPNFWDNNVDLADCYLTCEDVVDLLNEQHEKIEFVSLLANHRGEMIAFANSLIQDLDDETEKEMWETFKEEMWQKWKKQRGIK